MIYNITHPTTTKICCRTTSRTVALELCLCRWNSIVYKHGFWRKIRFWWKICINWRDIKQWS